MIIVDAVASTKQGSLFVPTYHRGHLSLRSETELTVCLLPPTKNTPIPGMNELVISPIQFDSWQHLVRITALFKDQPGVVRKLAYAVKQEHLDVMYEESATIENGRFHRVEFLASAKVPYESYATNQLPLGEVLPDLERRFKAICIKELVLQKRTLRLKVREMEGLRNAWAIATQYAHDHKVSAATYSERTIIENQHIRIPNSILRHLGDQEPRAILVSDTRDRVLRVLIPNRDSYFTYIRVSHLDRIGSLFRISDTLSQAFSAVVTLTRLKRQGSRNDIEFLLFCNAYPKLEDERMRREIAENLLASQELGDLFIRVSYPKRAGDLETESRKPQFTGVHAVQQNDLVPLEEQLADLPTADILINRIQQLSKPIRSADKPEYSARLHAARLLFAQETTNSVPSLQVFISYVFERQDLFDTVAEVIKESGDTRIASGKNPDNHGKPFRDEIRKRIKSSHGFIAIWDKDANSPWLLWELGVAQAFGIPVAIFPHAKLPDTSHFRLLPEIHHESFLDVELRAKFAAKWATFRDEMSAFDRMRLANQYEDGPNEHRDA